MKITENVKIVLSIALSIVMVITMAYGVDFVQGNDAFAGTPNYGVISGNASEDGYNYIDCGEITLGEMIDLSVNEDDVFCYTFVAPEDGVYYFFTLGKTDTYGALQDNNDEITLWADNDDSGIGDNFRIKRSLEKGETYVIMVYGYEEGDTTLSVVTEDEYQDAIDAYKANYRKFDVSGCAVVAEANKSYTIKPEILYTDYYGNNHAEEILADDYSCEWYEISSVDMYSPEPNVEVFEFLAETDEYTIDKVKSGSISYYLCQVTYSGIVYNSYLSVVADDYNYKVLKCSKTYAEDKLVLTARVDLYDAYFDNVVGADKADNYTYKWSLYNPGDEEYNPSVVLSEEASYTVELTKDDKTVNVFVCYVESKDGEMKDYITVTNYYCEKHHFELIDVTAASCTVDATAKYICDNCGTEKTDLIGAKLGHDYVDLGSGKFECSRCKDTYTVEPQSTIIVEPTKPQEATTVYTAKPSTVKPARVKKAKMTIKKKSIVVSWSKAKNAKSYKVKFATNKKFKKAKTKTVKKPTYKIKGIKKGKTYFVKVQSLNGKSTAKWSKVSKIKVK